MIQHQLARSQVIFPEANDSNLTTYITPCLAGTMVYIPDGVPTSRVFQNIERLVAGLAFLHITDPCISYATKFGCNTALRPCYTVGNGIGSPTTLKRSGDI